MSAIYTAVAMATGEGREGHVETSDGRINLDLALPPELGGTGAGTNPEQLVAMGYAACFSSALHAVARRRRVTLVPAEVTCEVSLERDDGGYALAFDIRVRLSGMAPDAADELVAEAHRFCPYSRAFTQGAPTAARAET